MTDKQQTAVQWLIEQILVKENTSYFNMRTNDVDLSYYVNQALSMEREQMTRFANECIELQTYEDAFDIETQKHFTDTYQTEP